MFSLVPALGCNMRPLKLSARNKTILSGIVRALVQMSTKKPTRRNSRRIPPHRLNEKADVGESLETLLRRPTSDSAPSGISPACALFSLPKVEQNNRCQYWSTSVILDGSCHFARVFWIKTEYFFLVPVAEYSSDIFRSRPVASALGDLTSE